MLEALLILACFVSGFLSRGFYDSVRERNRRIKEKLKPKVTKAFVEGWTDKIYEEYLAQRPWKDLLMDLKEMLKWAGVEVED